MHCYIAVCRRLAVGLVAAVTLLNCADAENPGRYL